MSEMHGFDSIEPIIGSPLMALIPETEVWVEPKTWLIHGVNEAGKAPKYHILHYEDGGGQIRKTKDIYQAERYNLCRECFPPATPSSETTGLVMPRTLMQKLISPHNFDGNGPVPEMVREAAKAFGKYRAKFLTQGFLENFEIEQLFAAGQIQAEWMRELYEALHPMSIKTGQEYNATKDGI